MLRFINFSKTIISVYVHTYRLKIYILHTQYHDGDVTKVKNTHKIYKRRYISGILIKYKYYVCISTYI